MRVLVPHRLFIAGEDLHQLARRATSDNSITTACGSLKSPESKAPISPMIRLPQEAATPRMAKVQCTSAHAACACHSLKRCPRTFERS